MKTEATVAKSGRAVQTLVRRFQARGLMPRASEAEQLAVDEAVVTFELFGSVTERQAERLARVARRLFPRVAASNGPVTPSRRRRPATPAQRAEVYVVELGRAT